MRVLYNLGIINFEIANTTSLIISARIIFGPEKDRLFVSILQGELIYLELVYLVTALVPSLTACLASSPGRRRRTAVWISRLVMVLLLL